LLPNPPASRFATGAGELQYALVHVGMTQCNRQGIRRIGLGLAGQTQQCLDHMLNLGFVSATGTNHRLFDLSGGVFMNGQAAVGSTDNRRAPGLPQLKG
jgi:hypothetical protein